MKIKLLMVTCAALCGCAGLPTLEHCDHVKYERNGNRATLTAECTLPVGSVIGIPVAK